MRMPEITTIKVKSIKRLPETHADEWARGSAQGLVTQLKRPSNFNLVAQAILAQAFLAILPNLAKKSFKILGISFEAVTTSLACRTLMCHCCDCPDCPKTHPSARKVQLFGGNFSYIDILFCELFRTLPSWHMPPLQRAKT